MLFVSNIKPSIKELKFWMQYERERAGLSHCV